MIPELSNAVAITPSDSDNLSHYIRAFMVTASGNVKVVFGGGGLNGTGGTVTMPVTANIQYDGVITKVFSTDTTATGIIGFW